MKSLFRELDKHERLSFTPELERLIYSLQRNGDVEPETLELAISLATIGGHLSGRRADVRDFLGLLDRIALKNVGKEWRLGRREDDATSSRWN